MTYMYSHTAAGKDRPSHNMFQMFNYRRKTTYKANKILKKYKQEDNINGLVALHMP